MASILGRWEVAMKESGVGETGKGLDWGDVLGGGKGMSRVLVEGTLCALRTLRHCDWRGYGTEMRK